MIKLFKTYNKAKDVFVKPKLFHYFGPWRKCHTLPVWRHGNYIYLAKNYSKYKQFYDKRVVNHFRTAEGRYTTTTHKVRHRFYWADRNKRKRLRRFGLGWLRPAFILPIWLSFYVFNHDVFWKWKWDSVRFEYPPEFTIVLFGFAFSFWTNPKLNPKDKTHNQMHYWESLISYVYDGKCPKDLEGFRKYMGSWRYTDTAGNEIKYYTLQDEYLTEEYRNQYIYNNIS